MSNLKWAYDLIDERDPKVWREPRKKVEHRTRQGVDPRPDYVFWFDQEGIDFGKDAIEPRQHRPAFIVRLSQDELMALVAPLTTAGRRAGSQIFALPHDSQEGVWWFRPPTKPTFVWRDPQWVSLAHCTRSPLAKIGDPLNGRLRSFLREGLQ